MSSLRALLVLTTSTVLGGCLRAPEPATGGSSPHPKYVMEKEPPIPAVLVNQVGYLPGQPKLAVVKSAEKGPLKFRVVDRAGAAVAQGTTRPLGHDADSDDDVHLVDFSSLDKEGDGFVLEVGSNRSHPFAIRSNIYSKLRYQALSFFYHQRSGIDITMPYAGEEKWTRPAGHLRDKKTPCHPLTSNCSYSLDVSGGWYDAGDHGKYVVNGGISVWTLFNQYERAVHLGVGADEIGDGKLSIPEQGNGVPDILDEARWELDFMMRMQVPKGKPLAGMVHHKMHDGAWTPLATPPHLDTFRRFLAKPSTAATLNLAAVAAQGARLWSKLDPAYSARCLSAAQRAWSAAKRTPDLYAPTGANAGGGPYDDTDVTDEFYWAAAELYLTTGGAEYLEYINSSPHHLKAEHQNNTMTWQHVGALGTISLAVVPNSLPADQSARARAAIRAAADAFVGMQEKQAYRVPLTRDEKGGYAWGSNSDVINNMLIMGLAHDFTGDAKYMRAIIIGMDYLLGRNPLDRSYITGYGFRPTQFPHHRFWSEQYNGNYPPPPPGVLAGGPNSGLQDPMTKLAGLPGCAPQKCYIDHIEAWSLNEVAINWNSPLAWVTAWIDEKIKTGGKSPHASP